MYKHFPDNISSSNSSGELYVVVEMCELGNLKEFLHANQNNFINELKLLPPETANGETKDGYLRPTSNKQRSQYAVSFRIKLLIFEKKRILKVHQIWRRNFLNTRGCMIKDRLELSIALPKIDIFPKYHSFSKVQVSKIKTFSCFLQPTILILKALELYLLVYFGVWASIVYSHLIDFHTFSSNRTRNGP